MKLTRTKTMRRALIPLTFSVSLAMAQDDDAVIVFGSYEETASTKSVNAFRTDTPVIDVPSSVSIITKEELKAQGIDSIGGVVDYTPGVINTQGEGHRDAVVFRGIRSTSAFFVDGLRDDVQYFRSLYNVEQVETLTGANALTFGRGGAGGVINRTSKKPSFDGDFYNFDANIDTFGANNGSIDVNQVIDEDTALRINAHYNNLNNHRDFFDGDEFGFNPTLTHKISDFTSVTFSYEHINHERFIDRGIPTANGRPVSSLDDVVFGDSELNISDIDANVAKVTFDHEFSSEWKGTATASFGSYDKLYQNFFPSDFDAANDTVTIDGYRDTTERDRLELSGELIGEFDTGAISHTLVIGSDFTYTSNDNDRFNANFAPDGDPPEDTEDFSASNFSLRNGVGTNINGAQVSNNFNTDLNDDTAATITTYSFFLQDEIALTDQLNVILGARFDSFDIDVDDNRRGTSFDQTDTEVSPRLGIVYKPVENLSLYASYSQTFLPNSGEQFASISSSELDFDPDEFTNIEVGVKWDITSDLYLTVAAFDLEQSIVQADDDNVGESERNESTNQGIEVALKGYITDKLSINAGYTYLDAENTNGSRPRETPEHSASIWGTYQVNEKLSFGLGLVYQDESLAQDSDSSDATLPDYVRVDAGISYQLNDNYNIGLHIENLFDTDYFPTSHTDDQVTVGAPINATFSVRGTF